MTLLYAITFTVLNCLGIGMMSIMPLFTQYTITRVMVGWILSFFIATGITSIFVVLAKKYNKHGIHDIVSAPLPDGAFKSCIRYITFYIYLIQVILSQAMFSIVLSGAVMYVLSKYCTGAGSMIGIFLLHCIVLSIVMSMQYASDYIKRYVHLTLCIIKIVITCGVPIIAIYISSRSSNINNTSENINYQAPKIDRAHPIEDNSTNTNVTQPNAIDNQAIQLATEPEEANTNHNKTKCNNLYGNFVVNIVLCIWPLMLILLYPSIASILSRICRYWTSFDEFFVVAFCFVNTPFRLLLIITFMLDRESPSCRLPYVVTPYLVIDILTKIIRFIIKIIIFRKLIISVAVDAIKIAFDTAWSLSGAESVVMESSIPAHMAMYAIPLGLLSCTCIYMFNTFVCLKYVNLKECSEKAISPYTMMIPATQSAGNVVVNILVSLISFGSIYGWFEVLKSMIHESQDMLPPIATKYTKKMQFAMILFIILITTLTAEIFKYHDAFMNTISLLLNSTVVIIYALGMITFGYLIIKNTNK
jgi:hypothetical protein